MKEKLFFISQSRGILCSSRQSLLDQNYLKTLPHHLFGSWEIEKRKRPYFSIVIQRLLECVPDCLYVKSAFLLKHFKSPDIIICLNTKQLPQIIPNETMKNISTFTEDDCSIYALQVLSEEELCANESLRPLGLFYSKAHQLKKLKYIPVIVYPNDSLHQIKTKNEVFEWIVQRAQKTELLGNRRQADYISFQVLDKNLKKNEYMMSSKSELTKTIENQQAQIVRLEKRFTDVVTAYKNLKKEKDALESTVQVLSSTSAPTTATGDATASENESNLSTKEDNESGSEAETTRASSEQQIFQGKLNTLQQNVSILAEQKQRMEQMFQSDKRKIKAENDELKKSLEEAKAENIINKEKYDNEIKELKKLLRQSQRDHERETADYGVMMRELQTNLSTERNKSETMEHQFEECRAKVVTLESQLDTVKKQYNNLNNQHQAKLNEFKQKDSIDLEELKRLKENIVQFTSKIKDMEIKHAEQLQVESKRNQQLEKKLADTLSESAQRMSTNEIHTAELSEQIGIIEKQRAQEQMSIQRLKERIAQLDVENALLAKASSSSIENDISDQTNDDDNSQDLDTLMQRIAKLKVLIRVANDRFGKSLTIEDILNIDREMSSSSTTTTTTTTNNNGISLSPENNKVLHSKCYEEIDRLKSELEKYRSKTVAVFKAKNLKDTHSTKEIDDLRNQIDQLREKLAHSQALYNCENDRHVQVVEKLEACLNNIQKQHRQEMEHILSKKRVELNELESELDKQRERTVRLLSEKDRELEAVRKQIQPAAVIDNKTSHASSDIQSNDEPSTIINELFSHHHHHSSSTIGGPISPIHADNNNLLYFIQEQQLREQEVASLRKQRHELEVTIRDLHNKYSFEINQLQTTIEKLNDDLEHMKLSTQRNELLTKNEHNIDYIKNVFYHYLLANDTQVKHTMANALMTILHFSTKEKAKVESLKHTSSLTGGGWFNYK
ncbi:unnamed protein product [Rotaria magnacalcarata]|nr:unnamed protein product [Rotaria magnacalcarata]